MLDLEVTKNMRRNMQSLMVQSTMGRVYRYKHRKYHPDQVEEIQLDKADLDKCVGKS